MRGGPRGHRLVTVVVQPSSWVASLLHEDLPMLVFQLQHGVREGMRNIRHVSHSSWASKTRG